MKRPHGLTTLLFSLVAAAAVIFGASGHAQGAKLVLKDGRTLEGAIKREGDGFLYFTVKTGKIEHEEFFTTDQIEKIERDADDPKAAKAEAVPADAGKAPAAMASEAKGDAKSQPRTSTTGKPTRVAILNFGPPSSWQGAVDSTVGIQVGVKAFEDALPLLERDKVEVVVIRVNSGGGLALEVPKFAKLFEEKYKKKYRTVAWIESAISAAAMSPYVLEEMYFMPEGNLGACTMFSGRLVAAKGAQLEEALAMMEEISRQGGRDPKIMRSMQIIEPLSCDIDEQTGRVSWLQDLTGKNTVNPAGQVLTLNAQEAMKYKFARGIAATKEELAKVMGLQEVEWVGREATEHVDRFMRDANDTEKRLNTVQQKYALAVNVARAVPKERRGAEVAIARKWLAEIKRLVGVNPNFELMHGLDRDWFQEQEEMLRELMR